MFEFEDLRTTPVSLTIGDSTYSAGIVEARYWPEGDEGEVLVTEIRGVIEGDGKAGYGKGTFTIEIYGDFPNKKPNWREILKR